MKISKIFRGVAVILLATLVMACPRIVKPSAEVSKYEGMFVSVIPVKVVGKAVGSGNPSYSAKAGDEYAGEFVEGRKVTMSPFVIAETEVTYGLWKDVQGWSTANGYAIASGKSGSHNAKEEENHPVTNVSWQDAIVWCNAYTEMKAAKAKEAIKLAREKNLAISADMMQASKMKPVYYDKEGGEVLKDKNKVNTPYMDKNAKGFRLPTSVEWEYAARYQGDDATNAVQLGEAYFTRLDSFAGATGNHVDAAACNEVAWYKVNSDGKTHPVAQKKANHLGLYDMSGNVWEWMYDGVATPQAVDEEDPVAPFATGNRVLRSGSVGHDSHFLSLGYRNLWESMSYASNTVGLRLVRSL